MWQFRKITCRKITHKIKNIRKIFLQRKINALLAPYKTTVTATIATTEREFTKWALKLWRLKQHSITPSTATFIRISTTVATTAAFFTAKYTAGINPVLDTRHQYFASWNQWRRLQRVHWNYEDKNVWISSLITANRVNFSVMFWMSESIVSMRNWWVINGFHFINRGIGDVGGWL